MSQNSFTSPHTFPRSGGRGGKPLFIMGAVLLLVAAGCLTAISVLLVNAGANAEPGAPGLIPGQSQVLAPVATLVVVTLVSFMASVFSFMIGAKRLMRSAHDGSEDAASRAAA